jgi:diacylglycerol kinase (ATP)
MNDEVSTTSLLIIHHSSFIIRLRLIFNPAAGRGRARRHAAEAEEHLRGLGAQVDAVASASPDDLTRLAAEGSRGEYDRVVVCGGDGTLHRAVRDFDLARTPLALLPLGSGDDFAKVCGLPRTLREACEVAVRGAIREVDVAHANGIRYMGVAGLGFDSEVAAFAGQVKFLRGSLIYLYAILRILPRFTPHRVRIDGARELDIMFATVGNSRQYGGGIRINPAAQVDDGQLDTCIVHRTTRLQLLRTLPLAYTGAHVKRPYVETGRGREFRFESERPLDVYADGERVTSTPVTFGVVGEKLKFVVPG